MKTPSQSSDFIDLISVRGTDGEIHQHAVEGAERLTTAQGVVVSDNQNSLRIGAPGPTLLEDFALREKIFHFDHERIPERVVHARGYGALGNFTCTRAMTDVTRAAPFAVVGKETQVFVRFSTVAGSKGLPDQIPSDQEIASVSADGAFDTRKCHDAIHCPATVCLQTVRAAARGAAAIIPPRKNTKPWKPDTPGAIARNEALRASNASAG